MKYKEIQPLLPSKWEDITLKQYQSILGALIDTEDDLTPDEQRAQQVDNLLNISSKLLNIPLDEIYKDFMPMDWDKLINHFSFIYVDMKPMDKPHVKQKKTIDVSFDNYILFSKLKPDVVSVAQSLPGIVKSFTTGMTDEEIENLNIREAMSIFFFAVKVMKQSLSNLRLYLLCRMLKQMMKETLLKLVVTMKKKLSISK